MNTTHDRHDGQVAAPQLSPDVGDTCAFRSWLKGFHNEELVTDVARRAGCTPEETYRRLETFTNEAVTYLPYIHNRIRSNMRILEVGSGIGFLSLWLSRHGYRVTALEPSAQDAYDNFAVLSAAVAAAADTAVEQTLACGVEDLPEACRGQFDFIFSFNVLEHIDDLSGAVAAMGWALKPGGEMLHVCPNYFFPYEPHLGLPVVAGAPRLTEWLFPKTVASQRSVWDTLNFVTARDIRRLSRQNGLLVHLEPGAMAYQIARATQDATFAQRQSGSPMGRLVIGAARLLHASGALKWLHRLPPTWLTPMTIVLRKPQNQGPQR